MDKKICIIGSSGFAKEVLWLLKDCNLYDMVDCFMEPEELWKEQEIFGKPVKKQSEFDSTKHCAVIGIGDSNLRKKIVKEQLPADTEYPNIIHPSVHISEWVDIGRGAIICAGNIITCDIKIGDFATINLDCTIGHDCIIGDYLTLNPSVNISGICNIGNNVIIGTGAGVKQGIQNCDDVMIGMGAVVVKNILEQGTYVGNPAKKIG